VNEWVVPAAHATPTSAAPATIARAEIRSRMRSAWPLRSRSVG
jgi:hypothetical protein